MIFFEIQSSKRMIEHGLSIYISERRQRMIQQLVPCLFKIYDHINDYIEENTFFSNLNFHFFSLTFHAFLFAQLIIGLIFLIRSAIRFISRKRTFCKYSQVYPVTNNKVREVLSSVIEFTLQGDTYRNMRFTSINNFTHVTRYKIFDLTESSDHLLIITK